MNQNKLTVVILNFNRPEYIEKYILKNSTLNLNYPTFDEVIEFDYDVFWRNSVNDGVYNAALLLQYPNTNNERFIGQQVGTIIGYKMNNHINLEFESNIIFPGSFLKQSNQSDTLYHFILTTEIKF